MTIVDHDPTGVPETVEPDRHDVLVQGTASIRGRRNRPFPLDRLLLVAGGLLLPIGIATIILGWYGVAHTSYTFEQNSYMVSGGLLGLGLVFTGGFLYFGYWMTRLIRSSGADQQETMQVLRDIQTGMSETAASTAALARMLESYVVAGQPSPARNGQPKAVKAAPRGRGVGRNSVSLLPPFVATRRGTLLHRPDCPVVAGKNDLRPVAIEEEGFSLCGICNRSDR